jgi:hypothetical protein
VLEFEGLDGGAGREANRLAEATLLAARKTTGRRGCHRRTPNQTTFASRGHAPPFQARTTRDPSRQGESGAQDRD